MNRLSMTELERRRKHPSEPHGRTNEVQSSTGKNTIKDERMKMIVKTGVS